MLYLSAMELAELLDCKPNQFALMAKRLTAGGWPFNQIKGGCPKVLRAYHDQRMSGQVQNAPSASNAAQFTPNRAALEALQHARKPRQAA